MRFLLETLPESFIRETCQYIGGNQIGELRLVSRAWETALAPVVGLSIILDEVHSDAELLSFSRFLEVHGKYTRDLVISQIHRSQAEAIRKYCPEVTSLSVTFGILTPTPTETEFILALASEMGGLKSATFSGDLSRSTLEEFGPIINRVQQLVLSSATPTREFLAGLSSQSVVFLTVKNVEFDAEFFAELVGGFENLEYLHCFSSPRCPCLSFMYDVIDKEFVELHVSDPGVSVGALFAGLELAPPPAKRARQTHLEKFEALQATQASELLFGISDLDPLEALCIQLDSLDAIDGAIPGLRDVAKLALDVVQRADLSLVLEFDSYRTTSLYLGPGIKTNASCIVWLVEHFPLLEDLHFSLDSACDFEQVPLTTRFPSLRRVFIYQEKGMAFWEGLAHIAPNLAQINISPYSQCRDALVARFPSILIGFYYAPEYFSSCSTFFEDVEASPEYYDVEVSAIESDGGCSSP